MSADAARPAHIAVLISGAFRTLTDCNETIARHVIDANPWARFDIYAHLSSDVTHEQERRRMEESVRFGSACVAAVRLETNGAVSAGVRRELPNLEKLPLGSGTARGKAPNIVKMFRGIGRAWQLLENHIDEQGSVCNSSNGDGGGASAAMAAAAATPGRAAGGKRGGGGRGGGRRRHRRGRRLADASWLAASANAAVEKAASNRVAAAASAAIRVGARYDLVLRLRPDLCFCGPLDLRPALRSPGSYWLPWAAPKAGLAFDQIAIGNPSVMALYASAYHASVAQEVEVDRRELYPEAVMWRHLERRGGVSASTAITRAGKGAAWASSGGTPIAHLAGFRASLARHRPDGSPHYDDPYGKLRQDLISPALNLADLGKELPSHQCKPRDYARQSWSPLSPRASCTQPSCKQQRAAAKASRLAARAAHGG